MSLTAEGRVPPAANELIIVPGHGVCRLGRTRPKSAGRDDSWCGAHAGEASLYIDHIRSGVELSHGRPASLLVFSGGQTRWSAGPRSEAQSYYEIARDHDWWGLPGVATRTALEEYARDGLENLLFSLARFREVTGDWPAHATIAGWAFKRERYYAYARLINLPDGRLEYVGVNEPPPPALAAAIEGERTRLARLHGTTLAEALRVDDLRTRRDPFSRGHPYSALIDELCRYLSASRS
jgi:hypothetical protein